MAKVSLLTWIGVIYFTLSGVFLIVAGPPDARLIGWLSIGFFGGMGLLAFVQTSLARTQSTRMAVSVMGAFFLALCCGLLFHYSDKIGNPDSLLDRPVMVRAFGLIGSVVCFTFTLAVLVTRFGERRMGHNGCKSLETMTRADMEAEINHLAHLDPFCFDPETGTDTLYKEWVFRAKDEWLDLLLNVLRHPPAAVIIEPETREVRDDTIALMLGAWAVRQQALVLPRICLLMHDKEMRPIILGAVSNALRMYQKWRGDYPEFVAQCHNCLAPILQNDYPLTEVELDHLAEIRACIARRTDDGRHPK